MEYFVGLAVAGAVAGLRFDRDRSFAPTILIVVAHYYVLFALMGAGSRTVVIEGVVAVGFLLAAVAGFQKSQWLVAAAIAGHGLFDLVHHWLIDNPGVPRWWPGFCMTFDVVFGAWLLIRLRRGSPR